MTSIGRRCGFLVAGAAWALAASGTLAPARADTTVYQGQSAASSGIVVSPWGSGEAKDSEEYVYTGAHSIRVTTHGYYQGARIQFQKPVDMQSALTDKNMYLDMALYLPDEQDARSRRGSGMLGPGSSGVFGPGGGPPGFPGGQGRGTRRGGGVPGGPGGVPGGPGGGPGGLLGPGGPGGASDTSGLSAPEPLKHIRLVLVTTDDKKAEVLLPLENAVPTRDRWKTVAVPTSTITGLQGSSGQVKEIRLFGDSAGVFYVGQIRLVSDQTPIRVDDLPDMTVAINDPVTFTASAEGGVSPLQYEWTLVRPEEPAPEKLPVDAEGRTFKHKFRKSGDYTVYLTARDAYGLKAPATRKAQVHVTL